MLSKPGHRRTKVRHSHAEGVPLRRVAPLAFADEGRPVEIDETTLDAASYVLEYDFDA
jgi:GntR family transcriptional regulator